ncbi:MAG TPA: DUF108 domain-containing protein [Candidatus Omnitrophica bacterium]|mgnify:FL=1|nr:DUF108 domain-containing protein [Candidatus Omnitrophota bacterium]
MKKIKIGIIGCGAIGTNLASFIDTHFKNREIELYGIYDIDKKKVCSFLNKLNKKPKKLDFEEVMKGADLIIESANIAVAKEVLLKGLKYKKDLIILSVGVFVNYPNLVKLAKKSASKVYVPSGAICGVDGLGAIKFSEVKRVTLTTSKSFHSLKGAQLLTKLNSKSKKEKVLFRGNIKDAIKYFPQNINVAATIFLASGVKDIEVIVKLDPKLKRNVHQITVESDKAKIEVKVENVPTKVNPKTSFLAILSAQSLLEKIFSNLKIGS